MFDQSLFSYSSSNKAWPFETFTVLLLLGLSCVFLDDPHISEVSQRYVTNLILLCCTLSVPPLNFLVCKSKQKIGWYNAPEESDGKSHWQWPYSGVPFQKRTTAGLVIPLLVVDVKVSNKLCVASTEVSVPSVHSWTVFTYLLLSMPRAFRCWPKLPGHLNTWFFFIITWWPKITAKHTLNSHSYIPLIDPQFSANYRSKRKILYLKQTETLAFKQ